MDGTRKDAETAMKEFKGKLFQKEVGDVGADELHCERIQRKTNDVFQPSIVWA